MFLRWRPGSGTDRSPHRPLGIESRPNSQINHRIQVCFLKAQFTRLARYRREAEGCECRQCPHAAKFLTSAAICMCTRHSPVKTGRLRRWTKTSPRATSTPSVADSLKALDLKRPIREADINCHDCDICSRVHERNSGFHSGIPPRGDLTASFGSSGIVGRNSRSDRRSSASQVASWIKVCLLCPAIYF